MTLQARTLLAIKFIKKKRRRITFFFKATCQCGTNACVYSNKKTKTMKLLKHMLIVRLKQIVVAHCSAGPNTHC